ncbi:MAG TPA: hypothetical protein VFO65_11285 [Acidimicrobiales bacterium]|nr:hypothetical protein [Acidimicrobiales bacterium]
MDIEGPVEAEVLVVFHRDGAVWLTGPCGAGPWRIESHDRHPLDLVRAMAAGALGPPTLVHSTSWRWDHEAVVLTFLVVVEPAQAAGLAAAEVVRADLARSTATQAPAAIGHWQVLEHALRHLAWLARDDRAVQEALPAAWTGTLSHYVPEPFRQLDHQEA